MRFKTEVEDKLKVMYRDKKTDRNPVYTNVDLSQVGLDVECWHNSSSPSSKAQNNNRVKAPPNEGDDLATAILSLIFLYHLRLLLNYAYRPRLG
jgi:hypothetical protein